MTKTIEEKIETVRKLRPIDDIFFEVLAKNKGVCEEILQTILEDKDLIVQESITQSSYRNVYGRSVRLDALCILGDGSKANIEVQRSDDDDHLRRARFNASSITVVESQKRSLFREIDNLYIIYISEFDFLKEGRTIYHIDKTIRESSRIVDDGLHEIFVNTEIDDKTDIAQLMSCFMQEEINDLKFPRLSKEANRLKHSKGGVIKMCEVMEKYSEEAVKEAKIQTMVRDGVFYKATPEEIVKRLMQECNLSEKQAKEMYLLYSQSLET